MAWIVALGALVPVMGLAADFSFKPFKRQHPYTDSGCCWAGFAAARGGDFNGDGLQDVAAIVDNDGIGNQLWVYRNRGAALPVLQARYTLPGLGAYARGIAVADFNEDGVDDVVVGTGQGISALVSSGNGRFAQTSFDEAQWRAFTRLRAMDFNHDGHYDVVGLGRNNDNAAMHLFLGDGRGHFAVARDLGIVLETRRVFADGWETTSLQDFHPVDVGNDGAVDLALGYEILRWWSNGAGPTYKGLFRIYRNNGAGLLPTPIDFPVDHNFRDFAVGDFNRDGRQDLATPLFAVWQQDSRGAFAQAYRLPIYPTPQTGLTAADLDGDGAEEAMTLHNGWWTYGFYLQRQRKLTGEWGAEWLLPGGNMFPDSLAVGDFFGSACNDAVVANDYEGLVFLEGQDCHARTVHEDVVPNAFDANGNGKSDLLLREPAAHRFVTWYMSGTSRAGSSMHAIGDAYRLAATGDFNGDGRSDLLWTSAARDLVISFSTGLNYSEAGVALAYAANWRVIGAADINGNGKDDILLRNAVTGQLVVWYMDGSRRLANSAHAVPVAYRFAGSGDFDHDGKQDLAWTSAQRDVLISRSTGTRFVDSSIGLTYNTDYALAGVSDIDGDGAADLLLRSRRFGKLQVWFMNGSTRRAYASKTIGGSYRLVGKGDFNGDQRGDLVWVNDANQILFALGSDTGVVTVLSRDRTRAVVMDVR